MPPIYLMPPLGPLKLKRCPGHLSDHLWQCNKRQIKFISYFFSYFSGPGHMGMPRHPPPGMPPYAEHPPPYYPMVPPPHGDKPPGPMPPQMHLPPVRTVRMHPNK